MVKQISKNMGNPHGVRLLDEDESQVQDLMDNSGHSFSGQISYIVHDWLHSGRSKEENEDITLAGEILKNLLRHIDRKKIPKIAKQNAKYVIKAMKYQVDVVDFDELSKRMMEWNNKKNLLTMKKFERKESVKFMQRHTLGIEWSQHQSIMYPLMFEMIGRDIVPNSVKYDGASFSFEIINH